MNWSDIKDAIGSAAPLVGSLLGGPVGGTVGTLIAHALGVPDSPDAVDAALKADPQALAKIRELEIQQSVQLQQLAVTAEQNRMASDTQRILAINATMQAESQSEHWPQYTWRPWTGFFFAPAIVAVYFVLPLCHIPVPDVPESVWLMWGAVLGVTAWHRGAQKRVQAGERKSG